MRSDSHTLIVATTNAGKVREVRLALQGLKQWSVFSLPPDLPEIEETGATFLENATLKAVHYSRFVDDYALADDSGLCVEVLGGRPGVFTARLGATAKEQNDRVLAELAGTQDPSQRLAAFRCCFVLARAGHALWSTETELQGQIALEPAGDSGFGFDPIFLVPELRKTLAQLTTEEKNRISARGQALRSLGHFLPQL